LDLEKNVAAVEAKLFGTDKSNKEIRNILPDLNKFAARFEDKLEAI
jgi:hypothetical protein